MSLTKDEIIEKLLKLKALSDDERGNQNERETARKMLESLMERNNISLSDLNDSEVKEFELHYQKLHGKMEKRLLINIISKVLGREASTWYYKNRKAQITIVRCTLSQKIEIEYLYEIYRNELYRELELIFDAFIHVNKIYDPSPNPNPDDEPLSPEKMAEIEAIMARMDNMGKVQVRKALSAGESE